MSLERWYAGERGQTAASQCQGCAGNPQWRLLGRHGRWRLPIQPNTLWVGTGSGLYRHESGGRTERYTTQQGLPSDFIHALLEDRDGQLWVGTRYGGLCRLVAEPEPTRSIVARVYTTKEIDHG